MNCRKTSNMPAWCACLLGLTLAADALAGSVHGTLSSSDGDSSRRPGARCDSWRLTITAAGSTRIDLTSGEFDAYLYLCDSRGAEIAQNDDGGGGLNSRIVRTLGTGEYLIEVTAYGSGARGGYTLVTSRGALRENGGSGDEEGQGDGAGDEDERLHAGRSTGALTSSDGDSAVRPGRRADVWVFTLGSRQDVDIAMTSTFDNYLVLYAGDHPDDGRELTSNDDTDGRNARIASALDPGTYCIEATSWRSGATGSYTLDATFSDGGDGATGGASGDPQANGGAGALTSDDDVSVHRANIRCDHWILVLPEGGATTIDLTSAAFDTYMYVFDSHANEIAHDDDGGDDYNSRVSRQLASGQYLIEVTGYSASARGAYRVITSRGTLSEQSSPIDGGEGEDDGQQAATRVSGDLSNDDVDSTRRAGAKCDHWRLSIATAGTIVVDLASSAFDTYLYLCDTNDNEISHDDDGGGGVNSRVVCTLRTGEYLVEATAYNASARGSYTLSVSSGELNAEDGQGGAGQEYNLVLDSPSRPPLTVGQPITISGRIMRSGGPVANLAFGAHDGIAQMSRWLTTDGQGRFSFSATPRVAGGAVVELLVGQQVIPIAYDVRGADGRMSPVVRAIRLENTTDITYGAVVTSPFGDQLSYTLPPGSTREVVRTTLPRVVFHPTLYAGFATVVGFIGGGDAAAYVDSDGVGTVQITGGAGPLRFSVYSTSELDVGLCWSPGGDIGAGPGVEGGADICLGTDGFSVGGGGTVGIVTSGFSIQLFEW